MMMGAKMEHSWCSDFLLKNCWLFLNQCQRDAEPELFSGVNGTDTSAEDAAR